MPGEGFTIKTCQSYSGYKSRENLQDVLKKENLSPARQQTLIKKIISTPDEVIKSKVSKNTVNQTILYSYKGMVLQFEIIIRDDGSVVIKDVKPVQDPPIRRPIPKPKLLGTFKSDCYARARVPGEGFTIKTCQSYNRFNSS